MVSPLHAPYLSIVATSRNDNHGGTLQHRMQAFVNGLAAQCERHRIDAELILVEWNPPADRDRLDQALKWPARRGPLRIRVIRVPKCIHDRYAHADKQPVFQMIAKNVGIRRARGEFVLVTNIDILFNDELCQLLAKRQLAHGHLYRINRHDAAGEVPLGDIDQQLAYCQSNLLRLHAREGVFTFDADGRRSLAAKDIVEAKSGIRFGDGIFGPECWDGSGLHRCCASPAQILLPARERSFFFRTSKRRLRLEISPGPSLGVQGLELEVLQSPNAVLGRVRVPGRSRILLRPDGNGPIVLRCLNRNLQAHGLRTLEFCLHRVEWVADDDSAPACQVEPGSPSEICSTAPWNPDRSAAFADGAWIPYLHQNASGDFMLMHRDHWQAMEGYAEFEAYSMNLDSLGCYTAHYCGLKETVLADPLRIYHIEHSVGSGWTPEGETSLRQRLADKGVPWIEFAQVEGFVKRMQREGLIRFNGGRWGVDDGSGFIHGDPLLEIEVTADGAHRLVFPEPITVSEEHFARMVADLPLATIQAAAAEDDFLRNYLTSVWEYANGRAELTSYPWKVTLPMADLCNASCTFCNSWIRGQRAVKMEEVHRFADLFRHAAALSIQGHGEPMTHPQFPEILEAVSQYLDPRCRRDIITNAALLKRNWEMIRKARIDIFNISLNAATGPTHQEIMALGTDAFPRILDGIRELVRLRDQTHGHEIKAVTLSMVVIQQNVHEAAAFVDLCNELRVDRILLRNLMPVSWWQGGLNYHTLPAYLHPEFEKHRDEALAAVKRSRVEVIGDPMSWSLPIFPPELDQQARHSPPPTITRDQARKQGRTDEAVKEHLGAQDLRGRPVAAPPAEVLSEQFYNRSTPYSCTYPYYNFMWTDFTFKQPPCCYVDRVTGFEPVRYDGTYPFFEAWNSPALTELRRRLHAGPLLPECTRCPAQPQPFHQAKGETGATRMFRELSAIQEAAPPPAAPPAENWQALDDSTLMKEALVLNMPDSGTRSFDHESLRFTTTAHQWEYALRALLPPELVGQRRTRLVLDIYVESGAVGAGVVRSDNTTFVGEQVAQSSRGWQKLEVTVDAILPGDALVVRNVASEGVASQAAIRSLRCAVVAA